MERSASKGQDKDVEVLALLNTLVDDAFVVLNRLLCLLISRLVFLVFFACTKLCACTKYECSLPTPAPFSTVLRYAMLFDAAENLTQCLCSNYNPHIPFVVGSGILGSRPLSLFVVGCGFGIAPGSSLPGGRPAVPTL